MAAHVISTISSLEAQQQNILKCTSVTNKEVIDALKAGIQENKETISDNIKLLKDKVGAKWLTYFEYQILK